MLGPPKNRPVSAHPSSPDGRPGSACSSAVMCSFGDSPGKVNGFSPKPPPGSPSRPGSALGHSNGRRPATANGANAGAGHRPNSANAVGALVSAPAASGGRRTLPAELGLAGRRVLTLPSHVDQCDQGENCCWRWLAHAVLKEASWLKEDLDAARQERSQNTQDRLKAEHDAEAFAELRGAHAETVRELSECRGELGDLRRELAAMKTAHAHKVAKEQELERDLAKVEKERRESGVREVDTLKRAERAERELARAGAAEEDLRKQILQLQDAKARAGADLAECRQERDRLRKVAEESAAKKKKGAKRPNDVAKGSKAR